MEHITSNRKLCVNGFNGNIPQIRKGYLGFRNNQTLLQHETMKKNQSSLQSEIHVISCRYFTNNDIILLHNYKARK